MPYNLANYKMDQIKAGVIIQELRHSRHISRARLAGEIGVSNDVMENIEKGRGGLTFERAMKICAVLKIAIIAFVLLLIKDEEIDFRDAILVYDHQNDDMTPVTDESVPEIPGAIPNKVVEAAAAVDPTPPAYQQDAHGPDAHALLDAVTHAHDAHIADLHAEIARQDHTIRQLIELLGR